MVGCSRGVGPPAAELVEATGGRVVVRKRRMSFWPTSAGGSAIQQHPSGQTPRLFTTRPSRSPARATALGLTSICGASGLVRARTRRRERCASKLHPTNPEQVRSVWAALRPVLDRRLAGVLPLALDDVETFTAELAHMARHGAASTCRWLHRLGGLPIRRNVDWLRLRGAAGSPERVENLAPLFLATWTSRYGTV